MNAVTNVVEDSYEGLMDSVSIQVSLALLSVVSWAALLPYFLSTS